jgi:flagellar protein FliO/FliZ
MMLDYFLRLALLLPMIAALAWGTLWCWRRLQLGLPVAAAKSRAVHMVDVQPVGSGQKLAVVEFGGRQYLLAVSRTQIAMLASDDRGEFDAG